jgi:hypothetical protein
VSEAINSNSPRSNALRVDIGALPAERTPEMMTFGSRTARTGQRRRRLVLCCASTATVWAELDGAVLSLLAILLAAAASVIAITLQ